MGSKLSLLENFQDLKKKKKIYIYIYIYMKGFENNSINA